MFNLHLWCAFFGASCLEIEEGFNFTESVLNMTLHIEPVIAQTMKINSCVFLSLSLFSVYDSVSLPPLSVSLCLCLCLCLSLSPRYDLCGWLGIKNQFSLSLSLCLCGEWLINMQLMGNDYKNVVLKLKQGTDLSSLMRMAGVSQVFCQGFHTKFHPGEKSDAAESV